MAFKIQGWNHFESIQKQKISEEVDSMGEDEVEEGLTGIENNKIIVDFNAHSNSNLLKKLPEANVGHKRTVEISNTN